MIRLGKRQTLAMYAEAQRLLQRCLSRAERIGGFSKELEARVRKAEIESLAALIVEEQTTKTCRKLVIRYLEYAAQDNSDDKDLLDRLVELHNRIYPEMEWSGEW